MRFILAFALALVAIMGTARVLTSGPCPQQPTLAQQALRFVAGWWITHRLLREDAPAPQIETAPEMGNEVSPTWRADSIARQNVRATNASGTPQLDHSAGW